MTKLRQTIHLVAHHTFKTSSKSQPLELLGMLHRSVETS